MHIDLPKVFRTSAFFSHTNFSMNKLFYDDNLDILRKFIRNETIDLCYIDPPFNLRARLQSDLQQLRQIL